MAGGELTVFQLTAVASDSVLARVVVLITARGGRVHELRWDTGPSGFARLDALVETRPGRAGHLAAVLSRVVEVTRVEIDAGYGASQTRTAAASLALTVSLSEAARSAIVTVASD